MIILLQCDLSWGQMCSVSCTQTATVRNMPYEEAYEIVQNREWELEDDFGDNSIVIKRYKRESFTDHRNSRTLWSSCANFNKKFSAPGTLIGTKTGQANYKSCRRRCIETSGCNYWSFVNNNTQGVDASYKDYCYLYSSIDTTCTSCTSITGCTSCSSCASCTYCDGGYCTDTGRISGDVSCPGAQALIACCRSIKLPCCPPCERYDTCDTDPDFGKFFKEYIEPLIPSLAANALVMIAQMVVPQFLSSAPTSVPQPGTPGGGVSPSATPANPIAISGNTIFAGLALVGAGQLVAVFDLPRENDNFAAIAGIFEEEGNDQRGRGKRGIREHIISVAKLLLWIDQTIERGNANLFSFVKNKTLEKFPFLKKNSESQQQQQQMLFGLFAEITLVEDEQCNLTPDTCSKFDPFLSLAYRSSRRNHVKRSYKGYHDNVFRRQGEDSFAFSDPTCNRQCLRF